MRLEKVKCKDIYWHLIKNITHTPKTIIAWENVYTSLKNKEDKFWKTLFTIPFISTRHTRLQSFQYKILHRTLPYDEWLKNIKIKSESTCSYCNEIDTITQFLIDCINNKYFWKSWARWWYSITGFNLGDEQYVYMNIFYSDIQVIAITPLSQITAFHMLNSIYIWKN